MEDAIEAKNEQDLAAIENEFSELNLRETIFKNTGFIDMLEDELASKEVPEKLSEELKIQITEIKKKIIDIGNFFSKIWDLPNIEEKEFYLKFSFLTLDFAQEKYGIDLLAEEKIGGNFREKFKVMSQSSSFMSKLYQLEKDIKNFGWDGYASKGPSTLEESNEISGRILMIILGKNKFKLSLEGSRLRNHARIEEIEERLEKIFQSNSFDYFVNASRRMKERQREREIEAETEEMDIPIQEEVGIENNEVSKELLEEMEIEPDSIRNLFREEGDETDSKPDGNRKRKEITRNEENDLEKRQKVTKESQETLENDEEGIHEQTEK
ncbi:hypothetical protein PGT21_032096 [Puccinia graminis f. sp. tritici]|uniref:Uncharacterized protein n=1 Tax=Puccinia graminis f. sp. tritici TaxID=56615 RepID=A0A5B0NPX1_PUCGR|nr:hypothetical protein PGTUg99_033210 [Puccinia graminis f. sp. tritici]KAA1091361.1 hypothetical protein PGT21_032096 [Puccinia graminis f. sp. tritici]